MTNPNCGICGHLNCRGFCNLTVCILPSNKVEAIQVKKPTNADRIRAMTDEELAEFLAEEIFTIPECNRLDVVTRCDEDCNKCWLDWLKRGV